jgi:hypothetical protein
LKDFISDKRPHVVAVTAESKEALRIVEDVQRIIQELTEEVEMPSINVELVDNEVAMVYENSNKGQVILVAQSRDTYTCLVGCELHKFSSSSEIE